MPSELQAKLLRARANGEIRAVGSASARILDVRIVAATLRDLDAEVHGNRFRADRFNRLAGWKLGIVPLRERRDDILANAHRFLVRHGAAALAVDAAEALRLHDGPGNVCELERVIAAAAVRASATKREVELGHLPQDIAARLGDRATAAIGRAPPRILPPAVGATPTRDELCAVLEAMSGNVARVAEYYGKDRQQFYRWAKRHDIDLGAYREPE